MPTPPGIANSRLLIAGSEKEVPLNTSSIAAGRRSSKSTIQVYH
jgi:hypothetical protein